MRLNGFSLARYEPGDELQGGWSREELEAQNARFAAALERAFELGLESRESARREVKLPASSGPRFVPPCPDSLLRSPAASELVFVARG